MIYDSSCCFWNLTHSHYWRVKCTTKLSCVCFLRVRPTWSSLGQTVPGKWAESHRGYKLQVCVSAVQSAVQHIVQRFTKLSGSLVSYLQDNHFISSLNHHSLHSSILNYLEIFNHFSLSPLLLWKNMIVCTNVTILTWVWFWPRTLSANPFSLTQLLLKRHFNYIFFPHFTLQTSALWLGVPLCEQQW